MGLGVHAIVNQTWKANFVEVVDNFESFSASTKCKASRAIALKTFN
jgi:hypothetical protein